MILIFIIIVIEFRHFAAGFLTGGSCCETGSRTPDLQMLLLLSDCFRVSVDFLIRGHEYGENPRT